MLPEPVAISRITTGFSGRRIAAAETGALSVAISTYSACMSLKPTFHYCCGKAGAGKSTVAKRIATECKAILLSEDVWMMRLFGDQLKTFDDYIRLSQKLKEMIGPLTIDLLTAGQTAILDFQANTKRSRVWFRSVFEKAQSAHVLHFVRIPDELSLERIAKRNFKRPESSHRLSKEDVFHVSSSFRAPEEVEGFKI